MNRIFILAAAVLTTLPSLAANPFQEHVRPTEPLSPEEEARQFKLPPGFSIKLFASEPDIRKPFNIAFDDRGRLWVSESEEYPYAAPADRKGKDAIKILEDTNGNGQADRITTFADGLNIPIGILPYQDGVIAWSIPNIWRFRDTDGDGRSDFREKLYGPLGFERDTHGMSASFRRGYDGWMYATHGFNNHSRFAGKDGNVVEMHSGNTYRIRLDGSRAEHFTRGQVNPFGLCFDQLGNLFSADCHSSPIYQLIPKGYYPSFGKPHDGLGFAPTMIQHQHGSTAISGICMLDDDQWPSAFRGNILVGNVVTSRVNRDRISYIGASPSGTEMPDFVECGDPWFRPVDLQLGPDGALYVADFYNRIIGHYEVPLDHPGRDRKRGRIWRISWDGDEKQKPVLHKPFNVAAASIDEIIAELGSGNATRRMLALNGLVDRHGKNAIKPLTKKLSEKGASAFQKMMGIWALARLGDIDKTLLIGLRRDPDPRVRIHVARMLGTVAKWDPVHESVAVAALNAKSSLVRYPAVVSLIQVRKRTMIKYLLETHHGAHEKDTHLKYAVRLALKNQFLSEGFLARFSINSYPETHQDVMADVLVAVPTPSAARLLIDYLEKKPVMDVRFRNHLEHAARYAGPVELERLVELIRNRPDRSFAEETELLERVLQGAEKADSLNAPILVDWALDVYPGALKPAEKAEIKWSYLPVSSLPASKNPFFVQQRKSSDGKEASFICSLPPKGETLTGKFRSPAFALPEKLSFFIAGHNGFPDKPDHKKNRVNLIDAKSGSVLRIAHPPRNDTAQAVTWDLSDLGERQGMLEIVDADTGTAYAWLAAGRFTPDVAPFPASTPAMKSEQFQKMFAWAVKLNLEAIKPEIRLLVSNANAEDTIRVDAANALVKWGDVEGRKNLMDAFTAKSTNRELKERFGSILCRTGDPEANRSILESMATASRSVRRDYSNQLASTPVGADQLLKQIEAGKLSPEILRDQTLKQKLGSVRPKDGQQRITRLLENLPAAELLTEKMLNDRLISFQKSSADTATGRKVFETHCVACHQVKNQGGTIAPQLDGVGSRGAERLIEDILDPNRNVDINFRLKIYTMKDDSVITGLFRREEGALIVLANAAGEEFTIENEGVIRREEAPTSIMPAAFSETIPGDEFNALLHYLMQQ